MSLPSVSQARSRLGVVSRIGTSEEVTDARRELAGANIAAAIRKNLAAAPPLTREQVNELHAVLSGGGA